jgi:hypothetical protein
MPNLVGTGLNQVPTNGMLGGLAYQSPDHASIKDLDLKNLSQINSEIADTAVDIFIYDTSKDSDGGAWRHRTTHTSWYNETLNTSTRGSRREFPAVAVLVLEATQLTIYDGDDPDLPMWMVFESGGTGARPLRSNSSSISMLNGLLVITSSGFSCGFVKFISDFTYHISDSGTYDLRQSGIVNRNISGGFTLISSATIVNTTVNDSAMTVLPNAPIDDATGLPIPTIAVATLGGLSIIKDDGTVVNGTSTSGSNYSNTIQVTITEEGYLWWLADYFNGYSPLRDSYALSLNTIPSSNFTWSNGSDNLSTGTYYAVTTGNEGGEIKIGSVNTWAWNKQERNALGGSAGLAIHKPNIGSETNSLIVGITSSYNTGWMHGDIKGAFLSDTDATNVTGTELVTNGTFDSNVSGWNSGGSITLAYSSGEAQVTATSGGHFVNQQITVTPNTTYTYKWDARRGTISQLRMSVYDNTNSVDIVPTYTYSSTTSMATYSLTFKTSSNCTNISVYLIRDSAATGTAFFDNASLRIADPDRSVNNKGLQVFGTITKTPVATGAELVGYSGFNASNHLIQPYNSSLNFGTGDFSAIAWVKKSTLSTNHYVFDRGGVGSINNRFGYIINSAGSLYFFVYNGSGTIYSVQSGNGLFVGSNNWRMIHVVRRGGTTYLGLDGVDLYSSTNLNGIDITGSGDELLVIGQYFYYTTFNVDYAVDAISLLRFSASAPSPEQIKKIYEDEKVLFQENAACTLYGSSDAVTALAYDEVTERLHVGTSGGRSEFQGLRRINNTTTAVTTAISAYDSFVVEQ